MWGHDTWAVRSDTALAGQTLVLPEPVFRGGANLGSELGCESLSGVFGALKDPFVCHQFAPSTAWGPLLPSPPQHRGNPVSPAFAVCL